MEGRWTGTRKPSGIGISAFRQRASSRTPSRNRLKSHRSFRWRRFNHPSRTAHPPDEDAPRISVTGRKIPGVHSRTSTIPPRGCAQTTGSTSSSTVPPRPGSRSSAILSTSAGNRSPPWSTTRSIRPRSGETHEPPSHQDRGDAHLCSIRRCRLTYRRT